MMKCEDIQIRLDEFVDNEISFEDRRLINEHICECSHCAGQVAQRKSLQNQINGLIAPPLSTNFEALLQKRIESESSKAKYKKLLPIAASIVLLAPTIFWLLQSNNLPSVNTDHLVADLILIEKPIQNDIDNFHKWTMIEQNENMLCGNPSSIEYCSI